MERIEGIVESINKIRIDIAEIKKDTESNTRSLEYHIRRTDELDTYVHEIDKRVLKVTTTATLLIPIVTAAVIKLMNKFI